MSKDNGRSWLEEELSWYGDDDLPLPQYRLTYQHLIVCCPDRARVIHSLKSCTRWPGINEVLNTDLSKVFHLAYSCCQCSVEYEGAVKPDYFVRREYGYDFLESDKRVQFLLIDIGCDRLWLFGSINIFCDSLFTERFARKFSSPVIMCSLLEPPSGNMFYTYWRRRNVYANACYSDGSIRDLYDNMIPIAQEGMRPTTKEELEILREDFLIELSPDGVGLKPVVKGVDINIQSMYHLVYRSVST